MKKMNRIYLLWIFVFFLVSCTQNETKKEKESPLDPALYAHPDSIIVHEKENIDSIDTSSFANNYSIIINKSNSLPIHGFKESGDNGETIYHTITDW